LIPGCPPVKRGGLRVAQGAAVWYNELISFERRILDFSRLLRGGLVTEFRPDNHSQVGRKEMLA